MRLNIKYFAEGKKYSCNSISFKHYDIKVKIKNNGFTFNIFPKTKLTLISASVELDYQYNIDDKIFCNGFQSWTDSGVYGIKDKVSKMGILARLFNKYDSKAYGDYKFVKWTKLYGFTYTCIDKEINTEIFGSLNERKGYTIFKHYPKKNKIVIMKDVQGLDINSKYELFNIYRGQGEKEKVFDFYFKLLNYKKIEVEKLTGYTSWYRHYFDVNESKLISDLESINQSKYKIDIFQIDESYENAVGDWLVVNAQKFPSGLEPIVSRIKESGMTPGIWLAPFVCEKNSNLFNEHNDYIMRDSKGKLVTVGTLWSGGYALDITKQEVKDYIKEVLTHYIDMGFGFFKLDFLYGGAIVGTSTKTRAEIMFEGMEFLREVLKGKLILGCGVPLAPAFFNVDYCRIGCDVSLDYDNKFNKLYSYRERVSTKNSITNTIARAHLNCRAFGNDPDVFILRDEGNTLSEAEKKLLFEVNKAHGSLLFTSDDIGTYDISKQNIVDKIYNKLI